MLRVLVSNMHRFNLLATPALDGRGAGKEGGGGRPAALPSNAQRDTREEGRRGGGGGANAEGGRSEEDRREEERRGGEEARRRGRLLRMAADTLCYCLKEPQDIDEAESLLQVPLIAP
jgi:hypothetical protein